MVIKILGVEEFIGTPYSRRRLSPYTLEQIVNEYGTYDARIPRQFNVNGASKSVVHSWEGTKVFATVFFLMLSLITIPYSRAHFWIMISALQICFFIGLFNVSWPADAISGFKLLESTAFFNFGINKALMTAFTKD